MKVEDVPYLLAKQRRVDPQVATVWACIAISAVIMAWAMVRLALAAWHWLAGVVA